MWNKNKGFTLLEVIVALFVLTTGVLGAYSVTSQLISYTHFSANRLIAAYLAKEGIEIVRNIRDTNWVDNNPATDWNNGLADGQYKADYTSTTLISVSNCDSDCYLNWSADAYYSSGSGKFQRKINIAYPNTSDCSSSDCLIITIEVRWEEKGQPQGPIIVKENLYNWKP